MSINNLCFSAISDVNAIRDEYFGELDLHFFGHITVYPTGKFHFLCSRHDWPEYGFVDEGIPPAGFAIYDKIKNFVVLVRIDSDELLG